MNRLHRHVRALFIAVCALALSGGAVLAARAHATVGPADAATDGLARAAEAAGKVVPVRAGDAAPTVAVGDEDKVDEDAPEAPDAADGAVAEAGARKLNHGWYVSEAAKAATPEGFDNHGAYVSSIAKGDDGKTESAAKPATAKDTKAVNGEAKAAAGKAQKAERKAQRGGSGG